MKFFSWKVWLSLSLLWLSAFFYLINYLVFRDVNYMLRLFLAQLGFLPLSVLLVTIIINQLLTQHAKRAKLAKLNMVIGTFFSEVGTSLLKLVSEYDLKVDNLRKEINAINRWSDNDFISFAKRLGQDDAEIKLKEGNLERLRGFLVERRDFLLRLLENPNLLEHDAFSDLLLAVFHLAEELSHRRQLEHLTPADQEHLAGDLKRVYLLLTVQWTAYLRHLKDNYPYLFSLALRTNPFDPQAAAEIT